MVRNMIKIDELRQYVLKYVLEHSPEHTVTIDENFKEIDNIIDELIEYQEIDKLGEIADKYLEDYFEEDNSINYKRILGVYKVAKRVYDNYVKLFNKYSKLTLLQNTTNTENFSLNNLLDRLHKL